MSADTIFRDETGAQRSLGYVLDLSDDQRRGRCTLTVDARHTNRTERVHGGILATLLDSAMGGTASLAFDDTGTSPVVTLTLTTNFIAAARIGDDLIATGTARGGGRRVVYVDGVVETGDGTLIATATGTFKSIAQRSS